MKPNFFFLIILISFSFFTAVQGQTKIDKFCLLSISNVKFEKKNVTIKVTYGNQDSLFAFKDPSIVTDLKAVEKQTTLADALNYLGSKGWTFLHQLPLAYSGEYLFCFKRSFDNSELK